jgi:7-cyano-7-deazaguanine synthase in queuosine biosynthesis
VPHLDGNNTFQNSDQYAFDFGRRGGVNYSTAFEGMGGLIMYYGLDDAEISRQLGAVLPACLADLVDIAVATYMSDRLAVRGTDASDWHRSMQVTIPVRQIDLWRSSAVQYALLRLLEFLTEDDWHLHFCQRPAQFPRIAESQSHLFEDQFAGPVRVNLFSGGLDSFAGAAAAITSDPQSHFVCVSGVTNHRQGERQKQQIRCLKRLRPASLTHLRMACWLKHAEEVRQEPTRRTRGFLFLALGAVAAISARADRLWLYENGVGALNLPYGSSQLGVMTSRSVNPRTLNQMGTLISLLTGREFTIWNGAVFQTKAMTCADPALSSVLDAVSLTFSCDAFPLRRKGPSQCGVCTSCLLLRLALLNADLQDRDTGGYRYDVYAPANLISNRHQRGAFEMHWQVARLDAALSRDDPWKGLIGEFPGLTVAHQSLVEQLALPASDVAEALVSLCRHHCREWNRFPPSSGVPSPRKAA